MLTIVKDQVKREKNMHRNNAVGEYEYKVIDAKSIGNH